jgi:hypothetical protein
MKVDRVIIILITLGVIQYDILLLGFLIVSVRITLKPMMMFAHVFVRPHPLESRHFRAKT